MYSSWEKPLRGGKQGKHPSNPSFSSILLDEIFNSIDGNEQNLNESKHFRNQSTRKPINDFDYLKVKATSNCKQGEEIASFKRVCLMEKLMEKKINVKVSSIKKTSYLPEFDNIRSFPDYDQMFFSTSSSSSSDSSSGGLSSSDAELYYSSSSTKSRNVTSCFSSKSSSSKPVKSTPNFPPRPRRSNHRDLSNYKQSECYLFDDYYNANQEMNGGNESEDNLMKSKSRASRIYNNLKKVKQPISPGGRLTSFITSLFTSGNVKKSKEEVKYERKGKPSSSTASTCSSASSFSRSCLSKSVPNSRGKFDDFGVRKTVHFYPVSVIVDEDSRACGHKYIYSQESYESSGTLKSHVLEGNKNIDQEAARDDDFDDEEGEDVDRISNSSSDLFEIDHLGVFGDNRFCEELPVYETTHLDRNRAIGSCLKL